jgi:hypothetical protein
MPPINLEPHFEKGSIQADTTVANDFGKYGGLAILLIVGVAIGVVIVVAFHADPSKVKACIVMLLRRKLAR